MDAARRPTLPPITGKPRNGGLEEPQVQCSLRLPPAYLDGIRELAERHGTSAGGAVMLLLHSVLDIRELAARHRSSATPPALAHLDALLSDLIPPSGLSTLR